MPSTMLNISPNLRIKVLILLVFLTGVSCSSKDEPPINDGDVVEPLQYVELPVRSDAIPETTTGIPHQQIDVDLVPEVNDEMFRRVYSLPGVENRASVVAPWQALWLTEDLNIGVPDAIIGDREFAHIHTDGSLHIFLEPDRALAAIEAGWAVLHPFAVQRLDGYDGFVMLYTPQSIDELNVTFQLIVDGYNYVTVQRILATDYYN